MGTLGRHLFWRWQSLLFGRRETTSEICAPFWAEPINMAFSPFCCLFHKQRQLRAQVVAVGSRQGLFFVDRVEVSFFTGRE